MDDLDNVPKDLDLSALPISAESKEFYMLLMKVELSRMLMKLLVSEKLVKSPTIVI